MPMSLCLLKSVVFLLLMCLAIPNRIQFTIRKIGIRNHDSSLDLMAISKTVVIELPVISTLF